VFLVFLLRLLRLAVPVFLLAQKKRPEGRFHGASSVLLLPLFERQNHIAQIALGLDQDQLAIVERHSRWALAGHMHEIGLGGDNRRCGLLYRLL
jgi:hypothetical protein